MIKPTLYEVEIKPGNTWLFYGSRDTLCDATALRDLLKERGHRVRIVMHAVTRTVLK